jgi:TonB family protein
MPESLPAYFGRYQVLEELGSGAMGVVYLCVDPRLARPVAVKVMKTSEFTTPEEREQYNGRFRNEAEAAGRLTHPDIVQIYDVGPSYIVMEFLEGESLAAVLRSPAVMPVRQLTALILRVADAIDYAHRNGIIHRDLKPANIMLMSTGGVKVMDFGVARLESSTLTVAGTILGSVRYMAPEQMMGERVDGRADIFSLAAVAYELLTGHAPFPGKSITEVVSRVVHGKHVPPRQANDRLPEAVNAVFARAFAPKPKDRYGRAMEFARDLEESARPVWDLEVTHHGTGGATHDPGTTAKGVAVAPASPKPGETVVLSSPSEQRGGVLFLDSDPGGADVYLDGYPVGQTPIPGLDVSLGRHVVRLEASGREPVSTELDVEPGKALRALSVSLAPAEPVGVERGRLVAFGPDVTPPRRRRGGSPVYPEGARKRGLQGSPVAEICVSETGEVIDMTIVESAGASLDRALLDALESWSFTPATLHGVPVSVTIQVTHLFRR